MTRTGSSIRHQTADHVGSPAAPPALAPAGSVLVGVDTAQDPRTRADVTTGRPVGALAWAVADAVASGRALHLLTACAPIEPPPPTFGDRATPYTEPDHAEATATLAVLAAALPGGDPEHLSTQAVAETAPGRSADVLLECAAGAGILVVGQRRRGALRRWVEGSTSMAVAGLAPVPVVVVPDDWPPPGTRDTTEAVTVGVDLHPGDLHSPSTTTSGSHRRSPRVERARTTVAFAASYAARHGVALRVVCAWDAPAELAAWSAAEVVESEERLAAQICAWLESLPEVASDLDVRVEVRSGRASEHLLTSAASSSLTVVGRHRRPLGVAGARLGSTSRALLTHAPCPVAVVPHLGD